MPLSRSHRDQDWVADLSVSAPAERREAALGELRGILIAGLSRAFRNSAVGASLVEDCTQDALIRIADRLASYRGESRFVTWAMSIALRTTLSQMRLARWRDVSLDQMVEAGRLPARAPAELGEEAGGLLSVLRQAIERDLTVRQREVIQAELSGAPPEEIARRLGANRNAIYKVGHDARGRLKQSVLRAGWSEEQVRRVLGETAESGGTRHGF